MYLLLLIILFTVLYVTAFKDDFEKEKVDKVASALALIAVILFALCIIGNI